MKHLYSGQEHAGGWNLDDYLLRNIVRGEHKKSGLTSEALTRVLEQLEQNGQVIQIPHIICNNLVYSSFF